MLVALSAESIVILFCFASRAALTTLFCTGFVLVALSAESIVILFCFASRAALTTLFCTGFVLVELSDESTVTDAPPDTVDEIVFPLMEMPLPAVSLPASVEAS
ncbi:MAG: hypothetical protein ACOXZ6_12680 [Syntrophomonadaceae bacterium]